MFRNSLDLGRLFGIRIRLNWSLIIIFLLVAVHLGAGTLPQWHPDWSFALTWGVAISAAVVFFASILLHELSHSLTARAYGIPVRSITLFLFGGVSNIEEEPKRPGMEALIAIVGPITSLLIGIISLVALGAFVSPGAEALMAEDPLAFFSQLGPAATVLAWIGPINILLAIFNMVPAFPLDGGRILRAILWKTRGDVLEGTRLAAAFSRFLSWGFIAIGIAMVFGVYVPFLGTGLVGGLWIAVIGWFIGHAARASYQQMLIRKELTGVSVANLMSQQDMTVPENIPLSRAAQQFFMPSDADALPVVDDQGHYVGWIDLDALRAIPREQWDSTHVGEVMHGGEGIPTLDVHEDAASAFEAMQKGRSEQIVVLDDGDPRGILRLRDIVRWLQIRGTSTPA